MLLPYSTLCLLSGTIWFNILVRVRILKPVHKHPKYLRPLETDASYDNREYFTLDTRIVFTPRRARTSVPPPPLEQPSPTNTRSAQSLTADLRGAVRSDGIPMSIRNTAFRGATNAKSHLGTITVLSRLSDRHRRFSGSRAQVICSSGLLESCSLPLPCSTSTLNGIRLAVATFHWVLLPRPSLLPVVGL